MRASGCVCRRWSSRLPFRRVSTARTEARRGTHRSRRPTAPPRGRTRSRPRARARGRPPTRARTASSPSACLARPATFRLRRVLTRLRPAADGGPDRVRRGEVPHARVGVAACAGEVAEQDERGRDPGDVADRGAELDDLRQHGSGPVEIAGAEQSRDQILTRRRAAVAVARRIGEADALLHQRDRTSGVALVHQDAAEVAEGPGDAVVVSELAGDLERLGRAAARGREVAPVVGDQPEVDQGRRGAVGVAK